MMLSLFVASTGPQGGTTDQIMGALHPGLPPNASVKHTVVARLRQLTKEYQEAHSRSSENSTKRDPVLRSLTSVFVDHSYALEPTFIRSFSRSGYSMLREVIFCMRVEEMNIMIEHAK